MKFRFCGDLDCPDWVLAETATLSKLSSIRIKLLASQIIGYCIQGSFNYEKILKLAADNVEGLSDIKGAIAATHFMITNAAKHDVDEQSLVQEIQQLGLPKENADALGKQYREHKESLIRTMTEESYRISRFISADWRVDFIAASSSSSASAVSGNILSDSVHLKLVYDTRPQDGIIALENINANDSRINEVACEMSLTKLDILVHELSDAVFKMESLES